MRDITKTLNLTIQEEEKSFRITKMDAFSGTFLMKIVAEKIMPLIQQAMKRMDKEEDESVELELMFDMLPKMLESMTQEETKKLMVMCLQTVDMMMAAGYQKVVDSRGYFGIEDLQYDTATCLRLTYEVIIYNCSGFFAESGLSSLLGALSGSRQKR